MFCGDFGNSRARCAACGAKARIMHLARCLKRRIEERKHYGPLTGKFVDVPHALLWLIHDGRSGQCNPSYETIADKADCIRSTVAAAIAALEQVGILSWVNRIHRIRVREKDLFGQWATNWRVVRTSNAYTYRDPKTGAPAPCARAANQGISSKSLSLGFCLSLPKRRAARATGRSRSVQRLCVPRAGDCHSHGKTRRPELAALPIGRVSSRFFVTKTTAHTNPTRFVTGSPSRRPRTAREKASIFHNPGPKRERFTCRGQVEFFDFKEREWPARSR